METMSHEDNVSWIRCLMENLSHEDHVSWRPCLIKNLSHKDHVSWRPCLIKTMSHEDHISWRPCLMQTMSHGEHVSLKTFLMKTISHGDHVSRRPCLTQILSHENHFFHCIVTWMQSRKPGQTSRNFQKQILIERKSPPAVCYGATSTHVPVTSVRHQSSSRTLGAPEKWVAICQSQEPEVSLSYVQRIITVLHYAHWVRWPVGQCDCNFSIS